MKNKLTLFLLFALLSIINCQLSIAHAQQFVEDSVKIDGYMRRFDLFLPEGIKPDAPLVFYLHGYGGSIYRKNPMVETATHEGFAVCIPQGLKDPKGKPSWNVGYPFQEGWKVDDVKSLCKIAAYHFNKKCAQVRLARLGQKQDQMRLTWLPSYCMNPIWGNPMLGQLPSARGRGVMLKTWLII